MKCYNAICESLDESKQQISVGVMAISEEKAKESAIKSLLEGKRIKSKVINIVETDAI